jgi:hypothetical protein
MMVQRNEALRYTILVLLALLWIVLVTVLSGCATYEVSRCDENGICSTANIVSPRKFKSIAFSYNGEKRTFELQAGDVGTDVTAISTLANVILMQAEQNQGDDQ